MKLCKRCVATINSLFTQGNWCLAQEPVSESDCEFWAHGEYLKTRETLKSVTKYVEMKLVEDRFFVKKWREIIASGIYTPSEHELKILAEMEK